MTPYECVHIPVQGTRMIFSNPWSGGTAVVAGGALFYAYGWLPFVVLCGSAVVASVGFCVMQFRLIRRPPASADPFDVPESFMIHHGSEKACLGGCGMPGANRMVVIKNGTRHALHLCDQHNVRAADFLAEHQLIAGH